MVIVPIRARPDHAGGLIGPPFNGPQDLCALSEIDRFKSSHDVCATSLIAREGAMADGIQIYANPSTITYALENPVTRGKIDFPISQVINAGQKSRRRGTFWPDFPIWLNPIFRRRCPPCVFVVEKTYGLLVFLDGA